MLREIRKSIEGVQLYIDIHGNPSATDSPFAAKREKNIECVTTEDGKALYEVGHSTKITGRKGKIVSIERNDTEWILMVDEQ